MNRSQLQQGRRDEARSQLAQAAILRTLQGVQAASAKPDDLPDLPDLPVEDDEVVAELSPKV